MVINESGRYTDTPRHKNIEAFVYNAPSRKTIKRARCRITEFSNIACMQRGSLLVRIKFQTDRFSVDCRLRSHATTVSYRPRLVLPMDATTTIKQRRRVHSDRSCVRHGNDGRIIFYIAKYVAVTRGQTCSESPEFSRNREFLAQLSDESTFSRRERRDAIVNESARDIFFSSLQIIGP